MTAAYPKMLYAAAGRGTVTVVDEEAERAALAEGYGPTPSDAHRTPHRFHAPEIAPGTALSEAHIPLIVDAVFDRLRGMATAAAGEPAAREAAEGVEALRAELDEHFATLKDGLLGEIRALIAPAPAPAGKKA